MTNSQVIDYRGILSDLRAKRTELDKAIAAFETLEKTGLLQTHIPVAVSNSQIRSANLSSLSSYDAAIQLLKQKGHPIKNDDMRQQLKSKLNSIADPVTSLYRALKERKDCQLKLVNKGEWGLKEW